MSTQQSPISSITAFTDRLNKDLLAWNLRKQQHEQLLKDYEGTLQYVQSEYNVSGTVLVDVGDGEGVYSEGCRCGDGIVIRMREDLYVQFKGKECEKVLRELVGLYREKIGVADGEIRKIMGSMRDLEELVHQYEALL